MHILYESNNYRTRNRSAFQILWAHMCHISHSPSDLIYQTANGVKHRFDSVINNLSALAESLQKLVYFTQEVEFAHYACILVSEDFHVIHATC